MAKSEEPTEPVTFTALEKVEEEERRMASLDVESFLELMIGLCLIGATTLAAILPLLAIANHPTGPALITMVLSASALFGALLVDKIREQNKGELDD